MSPEIIDQQGGSVSVIIGRVSTEDGERILETLAALRAQQDGPAHEVLLTDRLSDAVSDTIRRDYPEVTLIPCSPSTPLSEMRSRALERAAGVLVAVTEDHCVPPHDWLAAIVEAFRGAPQGTVAVGGPIENGVRDSALDWATFLCEYSAWPSPLASGPTRALPGMNVAYRREAIAAVGREVLAAGFWETTLHPVFLGTGGKFFLSDRMRVVHKKKFSFGLFARQRFLYSRYYAALRFPREKVTRRWLMCAASPVLPALILFRIGRDAFRKRRMREFIWALPWLAVFAVIWTAGEMAGYVAGPGDALAKIE